MEIQELKNILNNSKVIKGFFTENDIDFFIKNFDDEKNLDYVKVNGVIVPFRRICIGLQDLSEHLEETSILFIYDFKQIQIKIKDIDSIEFNPEFVKY